MTTACAGFVCPTCRSAAIVVPTLDGAPYKCTTCGWTGDDVLMVPFGNPYGDQVQTIDAFTREVLHTFTEVAALPIGRTLLKWGFLPTPAGKPEPKVLARFLKAMAQGMVTAIIQERLRMEHEEKGNAPRLD